MSAPLAFQLLEADPGKVEHAEVVAVDENERVVDLCGKGRGPRADITWRSEDPPEALPATFTDHSSCDGDVEVGEHYRIVRNGAVDDPSVLVVYASSWNQVAAMFGIGAGALLILAAIVTGIRAVVRRGDVRLLPWKRG